MITGYNHTMFTR